MPFKTITVTEEAYAAIKRIKRNDESFSELFTRISPKSPTVKDLFGCLKMSDKEFEEFKRIIAENRRQIDKESEERYERFWGKK